MKQFFGNEAFAVMSIRNFRLFMAYRFFLTAAILMQAVMVGRQLYDITKNPLGGAMTLLGVAIATANAPRLWRLSLKESAFD